MTSPSQQKLRVVGPTVVTANRLSDGKVLYRAADEGWTTRLEAAAVVTTTEAARELLAAAVREDTEAVDAYAAPVAICDGCASSQETCASASVPRARHSRCQQRGNHPSRNSARPAPVRLRRFRPHPGSRTLARVPRSSGAAALGRAHRRRIQAASPDEWRLSSAPCLRVADRDPVRHALLGAAAHLRAHREEI
jgi:hypothetical protein